MNDSKVVRIKVNNITTHFDSHDDEIVNFNNVIGRSNKRIDESSIKRMLQWIHDCDCAFISAYRSELKDVRNKDATYLGPNKDWKIGKLFTHEENRQKNKMMVTELLILGYGVAKIKGVDPEGMTDETSVESYLVLIVNRCHDENFLNNLLRIAEYYNQDSIYYKEKGRTEGCLIGTNNCGWPEYHQKGEGGGSRTDSSPNYLSRLGNQAFSLVGNDAEEEIREKKMMSALDFWRNIIEGTMLIKERIHPLTRKTMGEELRKMR